MKKRIITSFVLVLLILSTLLVSCTTDNKEDTVDTEKNTNTQNKISKDYPILLVDDYNGINEDKLNKYEIDVVFSPEEKTYSAKQKVIYVNNEDRTLDKIYFHIYPNTFNNKDTAPFLFNSFDSAYPNGFEPGYIDIGKVDIDGDKVNYTIFGEGNTILKLPLEKELMPGQSVKIYMEYDVVLPPAADRFGYGEKTYNFGNWYPIAAVYDDEGWNLDPYYTVGDPFYSDTSNYEVTITAPKEIVIAASGKILSEKSNGDNKVWKIEANLMRDFAWVASEYFIIEEDEVDGTLVKNYFLKEDNKINSYAAKAAYDSIRIFNETFGKYPYGYYSVVATSFPSGMEYPGIVFIGEQYYNDGDKDWLRTVIAHETGHQWWYSVIGNDEIDEAWLDESLTTYSEVVFYDELYHDGVGENYYKERISDSFESRKVQLGGNEVVLKSLDEFESWTDYGALVYNKGAMFVHEIEEEYGEDVLYDIYKEYYRRYKFLNATTEDFINVCEEVTGDSFEDMVDEWLYNK